MPEDTPGDLEEALIECLQILYTTQSNFIPHKQAGNNPLHLQLHNTTKTKEP
jgi:hypothetical protein